MTGIEDLDLKGLGRLVIAQAVRAMRKRCEGIVSGIGAERMAEKLKGLGDLPEELYRAAICRGVCETSAWMRGAADRFGEMGMDLYAKAWGGMADSVDSVLPDFSGPELSEEDARLAELNDRIETILDPDTIGAASYFVLVQYRRSLEEAADEILKDEDSALYDRE